MVKSFFSLHARSALPASAERLLYPFVPGTSASSFDFFLHSSLALQSFLLTSKFTHLYRQVSVYRFNLLHAKARSKVRA